AVVRYREARQLKDLENYDSDMSEALNVPCVDRLAALLLNVRRWRHTAQPEGLETYVRVDLAGQLVRYYRGGELVATHRVVVGAGRGYYSKVRKRYVRDNATPILQDTIVHLVVNPEWKVPGRL